MISDSSNTSVSLSSTNANWKLIAITSLHVNFNFLIDTDNHFCAHRFLSLPHLVHTRDRCTMHRGRSPLWTFISSYLQTRVNRMHATAFRVICVVIARRGLSLTGRNRFIRVGTTHCHPTAIVVPNFARTYPSFIFCHSINSFACSIPYSSTRTIVPLYNRSFTCSARSIVLLTPFTY